MAIRSFLYTCCILYLLTHSICDGKEIGELCSSNEDCSTPLAICIKSQCSCAITDVYVGGKCILGIGARCTSRPCEAENSVCTADRFCVCKEGYVQTYNNTFCYKLAQTHGDYCENDNDCAVLTKSGICVNNKCQCSDTTALHKNKCKLKAGILGGPCVPETEVCYLERDGDNQKVECVENICKCKKGVEPSQDFMSCGAARTQVISALAGLLTVMITTKYL